MANQSNYYRNRTHLSSLPSINSTESGYFHGHTREMGLPVPPPSLDIELSVSRTLPSPMGTASGNLDLLPPPGHGYSEMPFGNSHVAKSPNRHFPGDSNIMRPQGQQGQDSLQNWYSTNDGPWTPFPKVMPPPGLIQDGRYHSKQVGSRIPSGSQFRPHAPPEAGSFPYAVPHSDSGYGTRRSVANTSVFSGEIPEREDCQSLTEQVGSFQPFVTYHEDVSHRDSNVLNDTWPPNVTSIPESRGLVCPTCQKPVKTQSEIKKHQLRHTKPFQCEVPGCNRNEGFSTPNDLDRHMKSKHSELLTNTSGIKKYRCLVPGCKSKEKLWPRLDNFKSHLKRVHQGSGWSESHMDDMVKNGEFLDHPSRSLEGLSIEEHTLPDLAQQPTTLDLEGDSPRPQSGENWAPYPKAIEPAHDLIAPKGPQGGLFDSRPVIPEERPVPEAAPSNIVKPGDVVRNFVPENISLDRNYLVPAGQVDLAVSNPHQVDSHAATRTSPQTKTPRQNNVSDGTVNLKDTTISVLSMDVSNNTRSSIPQMDAGSQPNSEDSSPDGWHSTSPPSAKDTNTTASAPAAQESKAELEKKAEEYAKVLSAWGYTVSKEPPQSAGRQHNIGSAASHKSETKVTCQTCNKFTGRPCELKKHMKRHEKPYGCTFPNCQKIFGSKNDWKRHENSQHFHTEVWRCSEPSPSFSLAVTSSSTSPSENVPICTKVCYRRVSFQQHLRTDHHFTDEDVVKTKSEKCRLGRNLQARFWCGFCVASVEIRKKGLEAWTERFDHIDDHFMGRNMKKQDIKEWIPVDGGKPKGERAGDGDTPSGSTSPSSEKDSEENLNGHNEETSKSSVSEPCPQANPQQQQMGPSPGSKRRLPVTSTEPGTAISNQDSERPHKRNKNHGSFERVTICCQCESSYLTRLHTACVLCANHTFCSNCKKETVNKPSENMSDPSSGS